MPRMRNYEEVGTGARPPWWRTLLYAVPAVVACMLTSSLSPLGRAMQQPGAPGSLVLLMLLTWVTALALGVGLFWRHRIPFVLTLVAAVLSVILPLGNAFGLVTLGALIGRRKGRAVTATAGLVAVSSAWVTAADVLAQPRGASLLKTTFAPLASDPAAPAEPPWAAAAVVWLLGFAVCVGVGLLVRSRREAAAARREVRAERAVNDRLGDEVARRQERERIAREVHDVMGHRLSLLNLHAGALEAHSADDPRIAQSAQLVRESASAAMDDLRSLLGVLREPLGEDAAPVPLSRLAEVVRESFGAGQPLNSSIFISDADRADPALSRAVYRIVQELLTNARRHAPGEPVFLSVEGSPADGIVIDARNPYRGGWGSGGGGTSRGLAGISERAELLGGRLTYGLDEGSAVFRVHLELPWRDA